jgi:hypothetical protein
VPLALAVFVAALAGCATATPAPDRALDDARAALAAGEHGRAIELLVPHLGRGGEAPLLLARARHGQAEQMLGAGPAAPANARAALDQLALALPLAGPDPALSAEIRTAQSQVVALLAQEEARLAAAASPGPAAITAPPAPPPAPAPRPPRPPRPRPAAPGELYTVAQRKSFDGSGNSGSFASCVDVQVLGAGGPVAGAVIGVNNGEHSYQSQTDAGGYAGRCGLGPSNWSVVLFWTPAEGSIVGATTTVYLNGAPEQRAAVVFQRR